ncbi:MAG: hypothetical protein ACI837_001620 [Crocinitomicaceae bacterium]|jgi:hypothetical protein
MKQLLILLIIGLHFSSSAQKIEQIRSFDSLDISKTLGDLQSLSGYNKTIPKAFELSILKALSYFPELDSSRIVFKFAKINTSLNARPTVGSLLFRRRHKRKYVIRIRPATEGTVVTLDQANFNARVGVFGHELSHLADYSQRGFFKIMGRMFAYGSKRSKERFEKEIDQNTIDRGLGWQLHDWSSFVVNESVATEKYKTFKRRIYLEPVEIIEQIIQLELDNLAK